MSAWLLVPVKGLAAGKSRLRGWLDDAARRALNEFFLRRTLATACAFPGSAHTLVVSDCEATLGVAASFGVRTRLQQSGPGLNGAVHEGVDALQRFGAERVVVLPTDLPKVRPRDVQALTQFGDHPRRVAICPDKHGTGTNALAIPSGASMQMRFGEASLAAHCQEALCVGLVPHVHQDPRIALDIDTPGDVVRWMLGDDDAAYDRPILAAAVHAPIASSASSTVTGA